MRNIWPPTFIIEGDKSFGTKRLPFSHTLTYISHRTRKCYHLGLVCLFEMDGSFQESTPTLTGGARQGARCKHQLSGLLTQNNTFQKGTSGSFTATHTVAKDTSGAPTILMKV